MRKIIYGIVAITLSILGSLFLFSIVHAVQSSSRSTTIASQIVSSVKDKPNVVITPSQMRIGDQSDKMDDSLFPTENSQSSNGDQQEMNQNSGSIYDDMDDDSNSDINDNDQSNYDTDSSLDNVDMD